MRWLDGITTQRTWIWASSESWWWKRSLACCSPSGHKELDITERLNWTDVGYHLLPHSQGSSPCYLLVFVSELFTFGLFISMYFFKDFYNFLYGHRKISEPSLKSHPWWHHINKYSVTFQYSALSFLHRSHQCLYVSIYLSYLSIYLYQSISLAISIPLEFMLYKNRCFIYFIHSYKLSSENNTNTWQVLANYLLGNWMNIVEKNMFLMTTKSSS